MIDIQVLYKRVNEDLSRKNKSGYTSNDEFLRDVNEAQLELMNYYHSVYEATHHISNAISPFVIQAQVTVSGQLITKPGNFRHLISVRIPYSRNVLGSNPVARSIKSEYVKGGELDAYLSSHALKPNLAKSVAIHTFVNDKIKLWPRVKKAVITYLRNPADAVRAVTIDTTNDLEVYNAANSTHLEWPANEQPNFVDLLLIKKGLAVKETALIQWAAQKTQILKQQIL